MNDETGPDFCFRKPPLSFYCTTVTPLATLTSTVSPLQPAQLPSPDTQRESDPMEETSGKTRREDRPRVRYVPKRNILVRCVPNRNVPKRKHHIK